MQLCNLLSICNHFFQVALICWLEGKHTPKDSDLSVDEPTAAGEKACVSVLHSHSDRYSPISFISPSLLPFSLLIISLCSPSPFSVSSLFFFASRTGSTPSCFSPLGVSALIDPSVSSHYLDDSFMSWGLQSDLDLGSVKLF